MTHKFICFVALMCALQFAQAAERRSLIDDVMKAVNTEGQKIQQQLASVQSKFQDAIKNATAKAASVFNTTKVAIDGLVKGATEKIQSFIKTAEQTGKNFGTCVTGQFDAVKKVGEQTGSELQTCVQAALKNLNNTAADVTSIGKLALQYFLGIPQQLQNCSSSGFFISSTTCIAGVGSTVLSKALTFGNSISSDLGTLPALVTQLTTSVPKCGTDEVSKAMGSLSSIVSTVESCIQNGPPTSSSTSS